MSLETWKAVYYPVPADQVSAEDSLLHTKQKWTGMRRENLERHGVHTIEKFLFDVPVPTGRNLVDDTDEFRIGSLSCALCCHYLHREKPKTSCAMCPLFQVREGIACTSVRPEDSKGRSPFNNWILYADPEPMLDLIEIAIRRAGQTLPVAQCVKTIRASAREVGPYQGRTIYIIQGAPGLYRRVAKDCGPESAELAIIRATIKDSGAIGCFTRWLEAETELISSASLDVLTADEQKYPTETGD